MWYSTVQAAAVSPDGKWLVSGTMEGEIVVYEAASGRELRSFSADGEIQALSFFPDNKRLASKSSGGIKVWDYLDGKLLLQIQTQKNAPAAFSVSPDGRKILSVPDATTITVWDAQNGKVIFSLEKQPGKIKSCAWSPNSRSIITAASPGLSAWDTASIRVFDAANGKAGRVTAWDPSSFNTAVFSPDNRYIATAENSRKLSVWDAENGKRIHYLSEKNLRNNAENLCWSPNGKYIAAILSNGGIHVWDAKSAEEMVYLVQPWGYEFTGKNILFTQDQKYILSEAAHGYGLCLWEWNTEHGADLLGKDAKQFRLPGRNQYAAYQIKYKGDDTSSYKAWNAETYGDVRVFSGKGISAIKVEWSPDGKQLASYTGSNAAIWDLTAGKLHSTRALVTESRIRLRRIYITSPDGKLTAEEDDEGINVCRSGQSSPLYMLPTNSPIAFSPDSSRIAGIHKDGFVCIWDAETGRELVKFILFQNDDWIAICPEGYYNSSPGGDRSLNVRVGQAVYGIDQFRTMFYRPGIIAGILAGSPNPGKAAPTITEAYSFSPPEITITDANSSRGIAVTATPSAKFKFSAVVQDKNRPLKSIQVLVNGKRLGSDAMLDLTGSRSLRSENAQLTVAGNEKKVEFAMTVELEDGKNRIEVVAFNGYSEARKHIDISYEAGSGEIIGLPTLWILAIGANRYSDPSIHSLNYCVNDAKEVIEAFCKQEGKRYAKVNSLLVADGEALEPTAKNIRDSFVFLDQAGSRDVVLLFLAGHGVSGEEGAFYYLPSDASFAQDGRLLTEKAISATEILSVLNSRGNRLVFIDACHSGGFSNKTGAMDNDILIHSLRDSNAFIFTSSRGNELSQELDAYKHGAFSYALIQGLTGKAEMRSGRISMLELGGYVTREVQNITNRKQNPAPYTLGLVDFDIAIE